MKLLFWLIVAALLGSGLWRIYTYGLADGMAYILLAFGLLVAAKLLVNARRVADLEEIRTVKRR